MACHDSGTRRGSFTWMIRAVLLPAIYIAATAAAATAEPVTISSGAIGMNFETGLSYLLDGPRVSISFSGNQDVPLASVGFTDLCTLDNVCAPGSRLEFSQSTAGTVALGHPTVSIDGKDLGAVDVTGAWQIQSSPFLLPTRKGYVTATEPFTFTGTLMGNRSGQQLFALDLSGSGSVSLFLGHYPFGWAPEESPTTPYRFGVDAAQTPEPASMLLLGTGLLGLAWRRRPREA